MFFWYCKSPTDGKWKPVRSVYRPDHIDPANVGQVHPVSQFGVGYPLDMYERAKPLEDLVKRYPPPDQEQEDEACVVSHDGRRASAQAR